MKPDTTATAASADRIDGIVIFILVVFLFVGYNCGLLSSLISFFLCILFARKKTRDVYSLNSVVKMMDFFTECKAKASSLY